MQVFTLRSEALRARIIDYGGTLMSLEAPDRHGAWADVVLGFDDPERYLGEHPYFGGTVGRFANRISRGEFSLDGTTYRLACNDGRHHLHGGVRGFERVFWEASGNETSVCLRHVSRDGDEGYPGALTATVTYTLSGSRMEIDYAAEVNASATVVNLTNHAYFNLAGRGRVDEHFLRIPAERFVEVDEERIPTGELSPLAGTALDFRASRPLGATPIDHTFVLRDAAELREPRSGRVLRIRTTQPGVQVYTGDLLDGSIEGKQGRRYTARSGLCLEPQHFPDSPNRPHFPSTVLRPGGQYRHRSSYEFMVLA
jgi:aldose 1-epimerase